MADLSELYDAILTGNAKKAEEVTRAALEEKLLYPALKPHLDSGELFAEMSADHEKIRSGLKRIENARDIDEALEAVHQTLAITRKHFKNEEKKLYGFAEKVLDDETLNELGEDGTEAHSKKRR